jgi:hypothetical protein
LTLVFLDESSESSGEESDTESERDFRRILSAGVRVAAISDGQRRTDAVDTLSECWGHERVSVENFVRKCPDIRLRQIVQQRALESARRVDELLRLGLRPESFSADDAIICCSSGERTRVVAEAAKALNLPFVRFRVAFVEGALFHGGSMTRSKPVCATSCAAHLHCVRFFSHAQA